ncbi:hypothetical protein B0A55_02331 [Friedmanniomyces simplex]|uniref:non-specific serine/threonine protein kinase n=1 Tax=Friedmanniomyces simplex TaxID=329884 RepID=A0A4U0Y040_9PEZI|nr:hypothetical protein B0A55_02331 [Friedmanniomyces simplex]
MHFEPADIEDDEFIQEERAPTAFYRFYPTRIGEVLNHCYQATAKLGCGSRSTVWLARDVRRWKWQTAEYVSIKVAITGQTEGQEIDKDDLRMLQHINKANKKYWGYSCVRTLLDHFYVRGPADLSDNNIIFNIANESLKHFPDRTIYQANNSFGHLVPNIGGVILTDFDQSVFPELVPEVCAFETYFTHVKGHDKEEMIVFAKRMLKWMPEERETEREVLDDAWLQ